MSVTIFLFYFVSNLMYWLFGFKYWVISIEIPDLIEQQMTQTEEIDETSADEKQEKKKFWTETRYNMLNAIGIAVNFVVIAYLAWERGLLDYMSVQPGGAKRSLIELCLSLFLVVSGLLLVSAWFLADALRRLKKQFKKDKRLVVNQQTMCLHVTALFIHTFFLVACQFVTIWCFMFPSP